MIYTEVLIIFIIVAIHEESILLTMCAKSINNNNNLRFIFPSLTKILDYRFLQRIMFLIHILNNIIKQHTYCNNLSNT